jgi:hypothetical protein
MFTFLRNSNYSFKAAFCGYILDAPLSVVYCSKTDSDGRSGRRKAVRVRDGSLGEFDGQPNYYIGHRVQERCERQRPTSPPSRIAACHMLVGC